MGTRSQNHFININKMVLLLCMNQAEVAVISLSTLLFKAWSKDQQQQNLLGAHCK